MEMKVGGTFVLEDKGEVVGNLISAKLTGSGVEFISLGEYFEAKPLIRIADPKLSVKQQIWADGVSYRLISVEGTELKEKLSAYSDTLVYVISNPSEPKVRLRLDGGIRVFSWFNPDFRKKIADLALVRFEYSGGYLKGFYAGSYCICLASGRGLMVETESDQATYEVELELEARDALAFAVAGASSEEEARRGWKRP